VPTLLALIPLAIWTSHLVTRAEQSMVLRWQARGEPVPPPVDERDLMQRFWRFTLPRSLGSFFQLGLLWLDTVLLGALAGSREAGIYAASTRWLLAGNFVGTAVTLAFAPQITYVLSQRSPLRSRRLFEFATVWFVILAWPTYLTVMVFAPVLVRSFGRGFSSGAIVLVIIGAGFLFGAAAGPVDVLLNMLGESRLSLIDTGLGLALNVGLNLALIPRLGAVGAAYAWALSIVVINLLPLVQVKSRYGLHPAGPRWSRAIGIGVAYGAVAVSARLLVGPTLAGLAVGVAAGGALVLALLWWGRDRLGVSDFVAALPPLRRDRAGTAGATAEGGSQ
jgi:O-antigen/teichoic acid export membrane protein